MMDNIYEECFPHICSFAVCLTAGVFIPPRAPGNEMVSFCLLLRWHYSCISKE